jgi:hypothetical protein
MNLLLSSEINSLELAYQTETDSELNELMEFCVRYLNIDFTNRISSNAEFIGDWRDYVCSQITESIGRKINAKQENETFHINTGTNSYSTFIDNSKQNILRISGILSGKEYNFLFRNKEKMPKVNGLTIELQKGGNGYYDTIWGTLEMPLMSFDLNTVIDKETSVIAEKVIEFSLEIDGFKKWATHNNV